MIDINTCTLSGRSSRNPSENTMPSGTPVTEWTIAVNRKYDGKEEVAFVDCKCFGKAAENAARFVHKGGRLIVSGRLHQERWESKDGQKRTKIALIVNDFAIIDYPESEGGKWETPSALSEPEPRFPTGAEIPF